MNNFEDKNALFDIIMEVRSGVTSSRKGIKKIFTLLLSLHGSVGVVDGEVIYNPNQYAYLNYVDKSSSVITMSEGSGSSISRSMRMAMLEDAQEWEIRVGEQICSQVNESLRSFELIDRMLLLDQLINGMTIPMIVNKYKISKRKIYQKTNKIRNSFKVTFNLFDRNYEKICIEAVKKYIDVSVDTPHKIQCQVILQSNLELIDWEKELVYGLNKGSKE